MTNATIGNIGRMLICICLLQPFFSCKKVDQYANEVANFPSLDGTYNTSVAVGDTLIVSGRLFLGKGNNHIQVGDTSAKVFYLGPESTTEADTTLQEAKFIITASMGIGSNIPLTLVSNGYQIQGPKLTIKQFDLSEQTDTTLWVDQIGSWLPANVSYYQSNAIPLLVNVNNSVTGTTCFYNPLGIYTVTSSGVQAALVQGAVLTEGNVTYSIDKLAGGAISADGTTLYFSAAVLENSPDTTSNLIFRLAKMQLGNPSTVTTINRTLVAKVGTTNEVVNAFTGPIAGLEVVACGLQTDINGNVYFINVYTPQEIGVPEGNTAGNPDLYTEIVQGSLQTDGAGLSNTCMVNPSGQLKSIFAYSGYTGYNGTPAPGYSVDYLYYVVDAAGENIYALKSDPVLGWNGFSDWIDYSLSYYYPIFDIKSDETDYNFKSFDTSSITGVISGPFALPSISNNFVYSMNNFLPLPNGTALLPDAFSIAALIPSSKFAYCYAGTEAGLWGRPPSTQSNRTGKAKWVDFSQSWGSYYGGVSGLDRQGAIYFYGGALDYTNGLIFYKMYSKP